MTVASVIPARGGSKGIPRKNLYPIRGLPLVAHSIRQALATPGVDRTIVSTDDEEIAAVSLRYGAEVVMRPAELSGDGATSESALLHVLDQMAARGQEPSVVVFLQATSPFRRPGDIQRALDAFSAGGYDSLLSVSPLHGFLWRTRPGGPVPVNYDFRRRPRRQDAPQDVVENGSIYIFRTSILRETGNRLGGNVGVFHMGAAEGIQIDEPEDVEVLTALMPPTSEVPDISGTQLLVLDFDGVLTDNLVYVSEEGVESVVCNRSDGWGIARLIEAGINVVVISTEVNPVVEVRCRKLRAECLQGVDDKASALRIELARRNIDSKDVVYVGNDLNDLTAMELVGTGVAVADAHPKVLAMSSFVTKARGGGGAVREICDLILSQRN